MTENCETCGSTPPIIQAGPFVGMHDLFDYCVHCSKDLCDACMQKPTCEESSDRKHLPSAREQQG